MTPNTLILRTAGTNCDRELGRAFELAGAAVEFVHINDLIRRPEHLEQFDMLGLPGGFSYGDDIAAGRIYANRLRHSLYPALRRYIQSGHPVIGICNGFQLLVKAGLLPGFELPDEAAPGAGGGGPEQVATLADNDAARFIDRWVGLEVEQNTACIWTRGLDHFDLPIAHGEGRFIANDVVLDRLEHEGQVVLRYRDNPNGSMRDIAAICDPAGLVFGLMPHPERFVDATHHPHWTRQMITSPAGLKMFQNAVKHVKSQAPVEA